MINKNVAKRKIINVGRLNDDVTYYIISANPNDMFFGKARRTPVYMEDIISKEIGPEGEFSKTKTVGIARAFSPYEKEVLPKKLRQFPAKTFYTDVISTTQLINEFRKETGPIRFIIVNPDEKIKFYSKTALKIAAIGSEYDVVHEIYFNDGMLIENIQNVGYHKEDYEQIMVNETNVEEKTQKKRIIIQLYVLREKKNQNHHEKPKRRKSIVGFLMERN